MLAELSVKRSSGGVKAVLHTQRHVCDASPATCRSSDSCAAPSSFGLASAKSGDCPFWNLPIPETAARRSGRYLRARDRFPPKLGIICSGTNHREKRGDRSYGLGTAYDVPTFLCHLSSNVRPAAPFTLEMNCGSFTLFSLRMMFRTTHISKDIRVLVLFRSSSVYACSNQLH